MIKLPVSRLQRPALNQPCTRLRVLQTGDLHSKSTQLFFIPETNGVGNMNIGYPSNGAWNKIYIYTKTDQWYNQNGVLVTFNGIASDSRIKLNQTDFPLEESMDIVKAIKVKRYYNTELDQNVTGFIAQDVESVLPEAVEVIDRTHLDKPETDFRTLDYRRLQVHAFGAIQLLDQKLAAAEALAASMV